MDAPVISGLTSIFDLDYEDLKSLVINRWKMPVYRVNQIWQGLYQQFWQSEDEFTNLPSQLRTKLFQNQSIYTLSPTKSITSTDGKTVKVLFSLPDNSAIETVLMRYTQRNTVCISTQVGCPVGCVFCATGQMGFHRNLTSGEIIQQVLYFAHQIHQEGEKLTNIVLMGMGEPFLNYKNSIKAITRLTDSQGFAMGERRFTVSTVGIPDMIVKFAREHTQVNLAISLHAATDKLRSKLIPLNNKYSIDSILKACQQYIELTRRRVSFEWALIQGLNDTDYQIDALIQRLKGMLCHVNLIPLNPSPAYDGSPTNAKNVIAIQEKLENNGIPCSIRLRRGIEIQAGCGQLANQSKNEGMI